jgi:hypothetical protein
MKNLHGLKTMSHGRQFHSSPDFFKSQTHALYTLIDMAVIKNQISVYPSMGYSAMKGLAEYRRQAAFI